MKAYLITLQPHEKFFFGGENTFGEGNANYFVKSRYFPQQTALLGLLRYQVLAAHELLITRGTNHKLKKKASGFIGKSSFDSDSNQVKDFQNFGHIEGISHLFLKEGDTLWNFASKDLGFTYQPVIGQSEVNGTKSFIPHIPHGFEYKEGITSKMSSNNATDDPKSIEDFFIKHSQVGIAKSRKGSQKDREKSKQFYKQTSYRFKSPDMAFAFVAYFNDDSTANKLKDYLQVHPNVFFGGERSNFRMEMREIDGSVEDYWKTHQTSSLKSDLHKLVLLSDAYADAKQVYATCSFGVSEVVNFQHLVTKVKETTNYNNLNKKHKKHQKVSKSNAFNLLQKGSVFYTSSAKELQELAMIFEEAKAFRQIGYNAFVTLNAELKHHFYQPKNNQQNNDNDQ